MDVPRNESPAGGFLLQGVFMRLDETKREHILDAAGVSTQNPAIDMDC